MMRTPLAVLTLGLALLSLGCEKKPPADAPKDPSAAEASAPAESGHGEGGLPWKHDDWAGALEEAKKGNKPIVVDLWAPWCHTCISMQKTVLTEKPIVDRARDFVWLALDTDRPENREALKKVPVSFWPTFYVLSPDGERTLARHVGGASRAQFLAFLDEGKAGHEGRAGEAAALVALAAGDRAAARGDAAAAVVAFKKALREGGPSWDRRFAVRTELADALEKSGQYEECVQLGLEHLDDQAQARSASAADFVYMTTHCGSKLEKSEKAAELKKRAMAPGNPIEKVLADKEADLSADDRSDALRILRELHDEAGDKEKARGYARQQQKVLDDAVAGLDDLELLAGYAWPREEVYVYLGEGEKLVPEFEKLVKALPGRYDPPFRLAWLLKELGRYDEAASHAELALKSVYGPRKVRAYVLLAGIQEARGDKAAAKQAWQAVLDAVEGLDDKARWQGTVEKAKERLEELGG